MTRAANHECSVFLGLKGGVGTTTLVLEELRRGPGLAIDLDLHHGDLAHRLGVTGVTATAANLAALEPRDVDAAVLDAVSYTLADGGRVVPSPAHPELADALAPELVTALVATAGSRVVIDAGSAFGVHALAASRSATDIVLVGRADAVGQRQARVVANLLERAGITARCWVASGDRDRNAPAVLAAAAGLAEWRPRPSTPSFAKVGRRLRSGMIGMRVPEVRRAQR